MSGNIQAIDFDEIEVNGKWEQLKSAEDLGPMPDDPRMHGIEIEFSTNDAFDAFTLNLTRTRTQFVVRSSKSKGERTLSCHPRHPLNLIPDTSIISGVLLVPAKKEGSG
jgi:hypothetical protein